MILPKIKKILENSFKIIFSQYKHFKRSFKMLTLYKWAKSFLLLYIK